MKKLAKTFSRKGVKATLKADSANQVYAKYKTPEGCNFDDLTLEQTEQYLPELKVLEARMRTWCEANNYTLWSY